MASRQQRWITHKQKPVDGSHVCDVHMQVYFSCVGYIDSLKRSTSRLLQRLHRRGHNFSEFFSFSESQWPKPLSRVFNTKERRPPLRMDHHVSSVSPAYVCYVSTEQSFPQALGSPSLWCPITEQVSVVEKMGKGVLSKLKSAFLERSRLLRLGE